MRRRHHPGPNDCVDVRESLSARLDGEGATVSPAVLAAHVATCPACRRFDTRARELSGLGPLGVSARPPDSLAQLLRAELVPVTRPAAPRWGELVVPRSAALARWAAALLPVAVTGAAVPLGAAARVHVVPTHPSTPCTAHLGAVAPHRGR